MSFRAIALVAAPLTALMAALLIALPASARASTVSLTVTNSCLSVECSKYGQDYPVPVTLVAARPGEANRVEVTAEGGELVVHDDGAVLEAASPCRSVDDHTARCPLTRGLPGIPGLRIALSDGDDAAAVADTVEFETELRGATGDDVLVGGPGNDRIDGGLGDDRMLGGGGTDVLDYSGRSAAVAVSLASGGGRPGERDRVEGGFESLLGGFGADRLSGSRGADVIRGGFGADRIRGGPGADALSGDYGRDRVRGGPGPDRLVGEPEDEYEPPKEEADRLSGDRGDDVLTDLGGRNHFLGGPGRDDIEGGVGRDRIDAGPGDDRVSADDGRRDRVHCGAGVDRAGTDAIDLRRGCERRWR